MLRLSCLPLQKKIAERILNHVSKKISRRKKLGFTFFDFDYGCSTKWLTEGGKDFGGVDFAIEDWEFEAEI